MSQSKFIMAQKLNKVQKRLMGMTINDVDINTLIPLIFEECQKENITFWFNFIEDSLVLNLRDIEHENYELNIRYYIPEYKNMPGYESIERAKQELLINAFLITPKSLPNIASSDNTKEDTLLSSGKPIPPHIREAIKTIEGKGIPVSVEAIHNHLPLGEMSTSARLECNSYLKEMEASQ